MLCLNKRFETEKPSKWKMCWNRAQRMKKKRILGETRESRSVNGRFRVHSNQMTWKLCWKNVPATQIECKSIEPEIRLKMAADEMNGNQQQQVFCTIHIPAKLRTVHLSTKHNERQKKRTETKPENWDRTPKPKFVFHKLQLTRRVFSWFLFAFAISIGQTIKLILMQRNAFIVIKTERVLLSPNDCYFFFMFHRLAHNQKWVSCWIGKLWRESSSKKASGEECIKKECKSR